MRNYKELILVGGVFTLLAVLMSAALDTADAKNAFCQNNLKVLYVSVTEYQAAHNALPPVIVEQKPRWAFWSGYIKPFVKDLKNMACPEDARNAHMLVNVIRHQRDGEPIDENMFRLPFAKPELAFDWRCPAETELSL